MNGDVDVTSMISHVFLRGDESPFTKQSPTKQKKDQTFKGRIPSLTDKVVQLCTVVEQQEQRPVVS